MEERITWIIILERPHGRGHSLYHQGKVSVLPSSVVFSNMVFKFASYDIT